MTAQLQLICDSAIGQPGTAKVRPVDSASALMKDLSVTIPQLSDEQRQLARNAATEARRCRADLKQSLRTGKLSLAEVLEMAATNDTIAHTKVVDILRALPRVGVVRAQRIMDRLDIAANRRLRGLGRHQIAALLAEFSPNPQ